VILLAIILLEIARYITGTIRFGQEMLILPGLRRYGGHPCAFCMISVVVDGRLAIRR